MARLACGKDLPSHHHLPGASGCSCLKDRAEPVCPPGGDRFAGALRRAAAARVLAGYGCAALLRATYADATGAFVTTIGVAVLGRAGQGPAAQAALPGSGELRPGVHAVGFPGTLTASFTDRSRQVSSSVPAGPYLVMYTAGFADGRPRLPGDTDSYAERELLTAAERLAGYVANRIGAPPAPPRCPGAPGC